MTTSFLKTALLGLTVILFASCDKDFNEIGSGIIGDDHFDLEKYTGATVHAYNQKLGAVQTNNLPINSLGYYENPVFGKTTADFLTQVELVTGNPTFAPNPIITSVEMAIPYFSELVSTDEDGNSTYKLDSVQNGGNAHKIKLSIYESNYYLRDFDPSSGFQDGQKYFSDFNIAGNYNPSRLNAAGMAENDEFFFSAEELKTVTMVDEKEVTERKAPGMKLRLRNDFFQSKIFGAGATGNLTNNNTFKNYFRGLYFKVDGPSVAGNAGSMAQMNFKQGTITIKYKVDKLINGTPVLGEDGNVVREDKTFVITLTGNTVNIFQNVDAQTYLANTTTNVNVTNGDPLLYLKGQQGSLAIIDLFGDTDLYGGGTSGTDPNGVPDELDEMRNNGWLINEANLTFFIDQSNMLPAPEPNRIYLYDFTNRRPLTDFYTDGSVNRFPKYNKEIHGGTMDTLPNGRGIKYKIRITNHIRNLVKYKDSTNVRLGLSVTESIALVTSASLKTAVTVPSNRLPSATNFNFDRVPAASVINPLGTILFGSNATVPEDKRLKLEIYYTKEKVD